MSIDSARASAQQQLVCSIKLSLHFAGTSRWMVHLRTRIANNLFAALAAADIWSYAYSPDTLIFARIPQLRISLSRACNVTHSLIAALNAQARRHGFVLFI